MRILGNFLLFQLGWFASVLGAANGLPWVGPLTVIVVVAVHLRLAPKPIAETLLLLSCGIIGAVFDSVLVVSGWVSYSSGMFSPVFAPYWIIAMWCLFATTLNVSLRWLRTMPVVAAFLGLVAGPLTYLGGNKLGGIEFLDQATALVALGIGWAIMMPLLLRLSELFDGYEPELIGQEIR